MRRPSKHTAGELVAAATLTQYSAGDLHKHCDANGWNVIVADPWAVKWDFIHLLKEVEDGAMRQLGAADKSELRTVRMKDAVKGNDQLPVCTEALFEAVHRMDEKLMEDLERDGSRNALALLDSIPFEEKKKVSVFCTDVKKIDKGIRNQWMNWRKFRLFQIRQRCNLCAVEDGLKFWEEAMEELLQSFFQYSKTFKLDPNPYEQDERTTWIEYLVFNCLSRDGSLPEEVDPISGPEPLSIELRRKWRPGGLSSAIQLQHARALQPLKSISEVLGTQSDRLFDYPCCCLVDCPDWGLKEECFELRKKIGTILDKVQNTNTHLYFQPKQWAIISWIYEELRVIDKSPSKDLDLADTRSSTDEYPNLEASLPSQDRLARTQRVCDLAASMGWTDEKACSVPAFETLGGLSLLRDCFYGGFTGLFDEACPLDMPASRSTHKVLESFFEAEKSRNPQANRAKAKEVEVPLSPVSKLLRRQKEDAKKRDRKAPGKEIPQLEKLRSAGYKTLREELIDLCGSPHGVEVLLQYLRKHRGDPDGKLAELREKRREKETTKGRLSRKRARASEVVDLDGDQSVAEEEEEKPKKKPELEHVCEGR